MTAEQRQRLSDLMVCGPGVIQIVDSEDKELRVESISWVSTYTDSSKRGNRLIIKVEGVRKR